MASYVVLGADQREYGPVSGEQLRTWIHEGRLNRDSKVREASSSDWQSVSEMAAFADVAEVGPRTPPPLDRTAASVDPGPRPRVENYLIGAILVTACCCLPFGIPAIVYSAQVNAKLDAGDVAGAEEASRKARMWCWTGLIMGLIGGLIYFLIAMSAPEVFLD